MPSATNAWSRLARGCVAAVLVAIAPGCRTIDLDVPRIESHNLTVDEVAATRMGRTWAEAGLPDGHSAFRVLSNSLEALAARLRIADVAERTLDIQYYILTFDRTGGAVLRKVIEAADRGVHVRILVDDMYARESERELAALDLHPDIEVRLWNPWRNRAMGRGIEFLFAPRLNHRMHNKLFAADATAVVLGGRNLADEYFDLHDDFEFRDIDVVGIGPVARDATTVFDTYWNDRSAVPIAGQPSIEVGEADLASLRADLDRNFGELADSPYAKALVATDLATEIAQRSVQYIGAASRIVADQPTKVGATSIETDIHLAPQIRDDFFEARSEVVVSSPYFVPRSDGTKRLVDMARQGVRVRVLTNSLAATDVGVVHAVYSRYRLPLVKGGIELHELRQRSSADAERSGRKFGSANSSLHAKSFVVDGRTTFIGSLNLDPRSVRWNTEIGVVIESEELSAIVRGEIERLMAPKLSYRLVENPERGLEWIGESDGREERIDHDPDTTWWRRFSTGILGIFPIEGQV